MNIFAKLVDIIQEYAPGLYNALKSPTAENVVFPLVNKLLMLLIAGLMLLAIALIIKYGILAKRLNNSTSNTLGSLVTSMKKSKLKIFSYTEIDKFIKETGLQYMFGKSFDPIMFMCSNIILALLFFYFGWQISLTATIPAAIIGFFFLTLIGYLSNSSDNGSMLEDIKNVYDTLRIQSKAGVFLTSAISECYLVVKNKRLKKALLELSNDLLLKNDVETAANDLKGKFKNQYVDSLAVIIKQSQETGNASQMFEDISGQIEDIQTAMKIKEKEKIKTQIMICQALVYCSIIISVIYVLFVQMSAEGML